MRLAAAEQPSEQLGEMPVDPAERRNQPLPDFVVEGGNTAAQPRDRFGEVGALALQAGDPHLGLGGFALGQQINRAHSLALTHQPIEPRRRLGRVRRRFLRGCLISGQAGQLADGFGCGIEALADLAGQPRQCLRRAVAKHLEPGEAFASLGQSLIGEA